MRTHFSARVDSALVEGDRDPLNRALRILGHLIGSVMPRDPKPMPISIFKAKYGDVLKHADDDGVALISQSGKRYVIVSEDHMITISNNDRASRTVTDICLSLPRPHRAVDMSALQMTGASGDVDVPARRF